MSGDRGSEPVSVRVQPLDRGAGACPVVERWPLRTLAAWLFEGRECADVRLLLARGAGVAHGARATFPPVALSEEEFTAIERTFPQGDPARPLRVEEAASIALVVPGEPAAGDAPSHLAVSLRRAHPLARAAAARARYVWFDYGPWADVYDAPVTAEEATAVLAAARGAPAEGAVVEEIAERFDPGRAFVRYAVPRPGEPAPWSRG
jgi:hypothetical protein